MQALPKGETAGSWFQRRIKLQRAKNRTGPETWAQSRGTERKLALGAFSRAQHDLTTDWFLFPCRRACRSVEIGDVKKLYLNIVQPYHKSLTSRNEV